MFWFGFWIGVVTVLAILAGIAWVFLKLRKTELGSELIGRVTGNDESDGMSAAGRQAVADYEADSRATLAQQGWVDPNNPFQSTTQPKPSDNLWP
jgi:uncharacterized iron-regulated membrane protein